MKALLLRAIPALLAAAGILSVTLWLSATPAFDLKERLEQAGQGGLRAFDVSFPGEFAAGDGKPADLPGSWPRFRGANFDGISTESVPLARAWPDGGPKVLWSVPVGIGYAGPAVDKGRVYLLDYDETKEADALRCLSLADGREVWRRWYDIPIDSDHGISRTVPAVTDRFVVTLGPKCHVLCVEAETGAFRWGIDLVKAYGAIVPKWYAAQCPLIDGGRAILAPAGKEVLMMAVECDSGGTIAWKTPNPHGWKMTHSSIIPMDYKKWRMYIYCASGGVVGVAADDGDDHKAGDVLWECDQWRVPFANVPSPVPVGNGHVLLSGGYGGGSMMIRVVEDGKGLKSEVVWRLTESAEFGSEQQTPVFYNGHIFGVLPKEARTLGEQLVCMDMAGQHAWTSGPANRFGLGPYLVADGLIFIMDDEGVLTLAEARADGYKQLARAKVLGGHETWAPMALVGGRLLVRDLKKLVCLDVGGPRKE
ncbi:MAG TPA: PQQ-binding-like beta-propeller repeat protein [Phycisphaerae bacterium]|nr:PQQ-binding-like beta-propeller repeat protein [Phycisphaerae bacterium]